MLAEPEDGCGDGIVPADPSAMLVQNQRRILTDTTTPEKGRVIVHVDGRVGAKARQHNRTNVQAHDTAAKARSAAFSGSEQGKRQVLQQPNQTAAMEYLLKH